MTHPYTYQLFHKVLKEVGEGSTEPYKWSLTDQDPYTQAYSFSTDSNVDYEVFLIGNSELVNAQSVHIMFVGRDREAGDSEYSPSSVFSKGELYRVMSTILRIVKEFLQKHPNIDQLEYKPGAKSGESAADNKRSKLYFAYLQKQLPLSGVETNSATGVTTIKLK